MVKSIADDGIFLSKQWFENATVGIEAGCIEDGVFCFEVVGNGCFQFFVDILCAADESYTRHAEASLVHHFLGTFDEAWMVGQTKVVVCTEVKYFLTFHLNGSFLRAFYEAFLFVKSGFTNLCDGVAEMFFHFSVHTIY